MNESLETAPIAHQYESAEQQFDAGKLGVWLFLVTEVMFFSGLFVAYTIFRAHRPEVFHWAHYFLDTRLGAVNTCVLLVSSMTAAYAVRAAQLGARRHLIGALAATLLCGVAFLGIKGVEYSAKVHEGLLPGARFAPTEHVWELPQFASRHPEAARYAGELWKRAQHDVHLTGTTRPPLAAPSKEAVAPLLAAGVLGRAAEYSNLPSRPQNAHVFFGLYFFMTGLHGLHVLAGVGLFGWLLLRAVRGEFGPRYFGPVDYAALYWHLVDLIWIYLFPLLYLLY